MASPSVDPDIEGQPYRFAETQDAIILDPLPPPITITENLQLPTSAVPRHQATDANEHYDGNTPARQTVADNSQVQRDENQGDSSDGLWSMYLTEAEKQDAEVTESWKGDTDGILVFTGLFSATVAAFIIESYQQLSPDSSDTTNALLTQISQQLANISNGTPLTSVAVQSGQPFKPTASAVRVNVLWFLSLVLSLSCALSATLMQQWARRYRELTQRRGAFHRRGRMRAYIFEGIDRFGMARAVATMPTLLHISVFFFFAGLVDFLFPIYATVAYTTLACIMVFTLAYAILTALPTIYFNCPYATPLSGSTWRISQFSVFGFLWTILKIEGLLRRSLLKLHVTEPDWLKSWRETIKKQVNIHRRWFSQTLRKSVELSAHGAKSTVVTSALEWTLTALDEDREIEDFAARVPGFFNSRVVPDATSAVLSLMSHQPNTDPILGSRLCDLLKTCIPETSILDEKIRRNRLRICMKCLWSFAKAYNEPGFPQRLPSYFTDALASPEITRRVQDEEDSSVRVIGRCFGALIVNKLAADLESRADPISDGELVCLSAILGTESQAVKLLLRQPGAVAIANMISFTFGKIGGAVTDMVPLGVLDVVQQTFRTLSRAASSEQNAEVHLDHPISIIDGSDGMFEHILLYRLLDLLKACILVPSPLPVEGRSIRLRMCLKGLWYFGQAYNNLGSSVPLSSDIYVTLSSSEMTRCIRRIREQYDLEVCVVGRCVEALVVNKLAAEIQSRDDPASDDELACLSAILGTKSDDVMLLLRHPGAIEFTDIAFLAWAISRVPASARVTSDVPPMVQQTFGILSQALPAELRLLDPTDTLMNVSEGSSSLTTDMFKTVFRVCLKSLWTVVRAADEPGKSAPLPSYVYGAFANPEMTRRIHQETDLTTGVIGRCVETVVVSKLAADINSRRNTQDPVNDYELACLSTILRTKTDDLMLLLRHPGAIELTNMVFLASHDIHSFTLQTVPSYMLVVVKETSGSLFQALPPDFSVTMEAKTLMNVSDGTSSLTTEMHKGILRVWMKNLWDFTRERIEGGNLVPLPSYIYGAFSNPEMTRRIHKDTDLTTGVIGRCIGALVVNKLAADINSRSNAQVTVDEDELACLSSILGTKSDDVMLLLRHPGAIEFTNMVFLTLHDLDSFTLETVPPYMLDVVLQTSSVLSQALPHELRVKMEAETPTNIPDGTSSLKAENYRDILLVLMKNLWNFTREFNERRNSVPLPSYVYIAFTNPEITRRIFVQRNLTVRLIGRCIEALVVNKLTADLNSRNVPGVRNDELACLSVIVGTKSDDVRLFLNRPGAIQLVNLASLALGDVSSLLANRMMPDTVSVFQRTLALLSQALLSPGNAQLLLDRMVALFNLPDNKSERTIIPRLHLLFTTSLPSASSLAEDARTSSLRTCLKTLWHCARAYHQAPDLLPSYFPLMLARPETTRHFQKERDPVSRITGYCFGAFIVSKLVDNPVPLSDRARNTELACISAILGMERHQASLLPFQLRLINLRNVVSLMSGEIDTLTTAGMLADVLNMAEGTLHDLVGVLGAIGFLRARPSEDQEKLLQEIHSKVMNALDSNQFEKEPAKTLGRLRQILEKPLPGVE